MRWLYWLGVLNFVDLAAKYLPTRVEPHARGKRRVGFIRLDGIGDYVAWSHTFDRLEEIFPPNEFERILIGAKTISSLAEREPIFDRTLFYDQNSLMSSPGYRFRAFREIRSLGLDVIVNPRLTREFILMDSIVRISRAGKRIGSRGKANRLTPVQQRLTESWYTALAEAPDRLEHETLSNFNFLNILGDAPVEPVLRRLPETPATIPLPEAFAVLIPAAQQGDKTWPLESFVELGEALSREFGLQIVVCGGPGDTAASREFTRRSSAAIDLAGKLSLAELAGVFSKARIAISNDTGAAHIAVAQGCPTVVVTPGNHVGRFFPYPAELVGKHRKQTSVVHRMPCFDCDWHCVFKDVPPDKPKPCVANVALADVLIAAREMLVPASLADPAAAV